METKNFLSFDCSFLAHGGKQAVLMMHGYGADRNDLAPLALHLDAQKQYDWILPNAPMMLPAVFPGQESRAWFALDEQALNRALTSGEPHQFSKINPPGMEEQIVAIKKLVNHLKELYPGGIVIAGFSQGAMMALGVTLDMWRDLLGTVLFSAGMINETRWELHLEQIGDDYPIFQSHGEQDMVLPVVMGEAIQKKIANEKRPFVKFQGGHEIPLEVVTKARDFLSSLS